MQNFNPCNAEKTAEIMSRYRPIAPKPQTPIEEDASFVPEGIRKSAFLTSVWNNLQARPTRTRKRGKTAFAPPSAVRKSRTSLLGDLPIPCNPLVQPLPATIAIAFVPNNPSGNGLPSLSLVPSLLPLKCGLHAPLTTASSAVSIPFFPPLPSGASEEALDLNKAADDVEVIDLVESPKPAAVISPQALRPVGSSISVRLITEDEGNSQTSGNKIPVKKKAEEVETEIEHEALPTVVSDSNNKVRLSNTAYNEMLGQPKCSWLEFTSPSSSGGRACKRIAGEVALDFTDARSLGKLYKSSTEGFTCWVQIEWTRDGKKRRVDTLGDVSRLRCESKDYLFQWRFHLREASSEAVS